MYIHIYVYIHIHIIIHDYVMLYDMIVYCTSVPKRGRHSATFCPPNAPVQWQPDD